MDERKLERLEQKQDRQRIKIKRKKEERSAKGAVLDKLTVESVNKLITKGFVQNFIGIISAGKEANVYFAYGPNQEKLAIKIYKIDPQNIKWMKNYIIGDPRFNKIGTSTNKIIYTWCKKEFKNLTQLHRFGISVPKPLASINNLLVMDFIGDDNGTPALRLKDVEEFQNPALDLEFIISEIRKMYLDAHLVHGDLSEYNILYFQNKPIIIDVSQAVSIFHINAPLYLHRDLTNVLNFYSNFIPKEQLPDVDALASDIISKVKTQ